MLSSLLSFDCPWETLLQHAVIVGPVSVCKYFLMSIRMKRLWEQWTQHCHGVLALCSKPQGPGFKSQPVYGWIHWSEAQPARSSLADFQWAGKLAEKHPMKFVFQLGNLEFSLNFAALTYFDVRIKFRIKFLFLGFGVLTWMLTLPF